MEYERKILLVDLFRAYYDARKHKRNTINQLRFELNYEKNLVELRDDIAGRRYRLSPGVCFIVDKPVKREIFAADFRDRVVHHLLYNYINNALDTLFIADSYSCRKGRGTLFGIRRIEGFIRECSENYTRGCYILKLDIQGYFMSMDKAILHRLITQYIDELTAGNGGSNPFGAGKELLVYLIETILEDNPADNYKLRGSRADWNGLPASKSLFHAREDCGLPIGNLTSQLFSNIYLHPLDIFVKETLGFPYYGRYVDDFILVHTNRELLKEATGKIRNFLKGELRLELHPKKIYLQHYAKGVNFLGATLKPNRSYVSNRTKKNYIRNIDHWNRRLADAEPSKANLSKMRASINSYLGTMRHHYSYNIRKYILAGKYGSAVLKYGYMNKGLMRLVIRKKYR
ncbi:MAG: hypothetical protein LBS20_09270 [Prevotella sp.]|jgi:hypothetical protein|nr:hypothetical protein [Prevotella sp.]